jgi:ElaB/YqjD/DUF883 family membrane-anchored ribosome-binding protein
MSEKIKPLDLKLESTLKEITRDIRNLKKASEKYSTDIEKIMKKRPLESAGMIFIAGLVLGILIGAATCKKK